MYKKRSTSDHHSDHTPPQRNREVFKSILINPRLRACAAEGIAVGLSVYVCVCLCVCVCPSVRLSVFLGNRGNSERETWTYYQVGGMHGKIRFWSGKSRGSW